MFITKIVDLLIVTITNKALELIRREQSNVEKDLIYLRKGETISRQPSREDLAKEARIYKLASNYRAEQWKSYLDGIAANMVSHKTYKRSKVDKYCGDSDCD